MLKEKSPDKGAVQRNIDAKKTLELARQSHEKYLIRLQNSDLNDAVENYIKTLKLNPNLSETYYRLASLLWDDGQISLDSAIEQCKVATGLCPRNANAHIYTAYFLKLANRFDEAEEAFNIAISLHPLKSARPRLFLSILLLEKMSVQKITFKDFSNCLRHFFSGSLMMLWDTASLKMLYKNFIDDFSVFKYKLIGTIFESLNKSTLAMKTYSFAAERTGRGELFYQNIGDLNLRENNAPLAAKAYRKALKSNPYNREVLFKLATVVQTYFEDSFDEAIDCYTKLLQIEQDNAKIYYELGHLYLQKNDKINSINAFKLALEIEEDNPFFHNSLAYSLVQVEHYDAAIEHYKKAISFNPDNDWTSIVCQALGLIYYQIKNNNEAALAFYDMSIVLNPNATEAYLTMGDIYFDEDNLDCAIKYYCDAIKTDPENSRAYGKVGVALWERDFIEESIIAYNKAIKLDSEYFIACNNLGVIYLDGIGNIKESVRLFEDAIKINPNYTLAYFNLGRAHQSLKNNMLAAKYYQAAIDLNKITNELDESDVQSRLYELFKVK